eukprot:TRINITY_DN18535_c1_g2_i1.p1 TRINITY_DN18535_c1_g2~~TRINITY_DN18535_c1_g2_i1.p1  ORF type:complete len:758 (+),score=183.12 TRINITY_DN18535_c1_g2_i1:63-2336(+)
MSGVGHSKLSLSSLNKNGILLMPPRPPDGDGGRRHTRSYNVTKSNSEEIRGMTMEHRSPGTPVGSPSPRLERRPAPLGGLKKHVMIPSEGSPTRPYHLGKRASSGSGHGIMGIPHESPHEASVKERRLSLERMEAEALRGNYEKNEEYRERVRRIGSDRSLTKLMEADSERREHLWITLIYSMTSIKAVADIVEQRRASAQLKHLLLPVCWKWVKCLCRARSMKQLIAGRVSNMMKPTVASLKAIKFFQNWPTYILTRLVDGMEPVCHKHGEFVCFEGDIGDKMYIIANGALDVYVRQENAIEKSRALGVKVATISADSQPYFGEYAVVCGEPRFASVRAATPHVDLWAVSSAFVSTQLDELPIDVRRDIANYAGQRRQANLKKLYPIKATMLAQSGSIFRVFDEALLQELVAKFVPVVVRSPSVIYSEGEASDKMYLVATGEVELSRTRSEGVVTVRQGVAFGEAELLFVEKRGYTAETKGPADLWALEKLEFMQFLLTHPELFMAAKGIVSKMRSQTAIECSNQPWLRDSLLTKYLPVKLLRRFNSILIPKVVGRADYVAGHNEEYEGIYIIASGSVRDEKTQVVYGEDSLLGKAELLTFQPRWSTSYIAEERCDVWFISKSRIFAEMMAHYKDMLAKLADSTVQEKIRKQYMQPYQPPSVFSQLVKQLEDGTPLVPRINKFTTSQFSPASFRSESSVSRVQQDFAEDMSVMSEAQNSPPQEKQAEEVAIQPVKSLRSDSPDVPPTPLLASLLGG